MQDTHILRAEKNYLQSNPRLTFPPFFNCPSMEVTQQ